MRLSICLLVLMTTAAPAFAGIGADQYGTREMATCPDRKAAPTSETAAQYFRCDAESAWDNNIYLVNNISVEVAPKGRPFNIATDSFSGVDPSQPIFDIRGSFRQWQCGSKDSLSWENSPGAACDYKDEPQATGECYNDTFGDWYCTMVDLTTDGPTVQNQAPPAD